MIQGVGVGDMVTIPTALSYGHTATASPLTHGRAQKVTFRQKYG
jgi:hypothetical protein